MGMDFTKEQLAAIDARGKDLLVAAAAGSGKTAVLVERIMRIITDADKPVDLDRLLIVTFTEAAAAEMRGRIEAALIKRLELQPGNERAAKQLALVPIASISTIHAFCRRIMKQYFNLADLDPDFRVGDDAELRLIKAQVMEDLFEEEYAIEDNVDFFELVECFGGGKTKDIGLGELVERIYEFVQSSPYPAETLDRYEAMFGLEEGELDSTSWAGVLKEEIWREAQGAIDSVDRLIGMASAEQGPIKYIAALKSDRLAAEGLIGTLEGTLLESYEYLKSMKWSRIFSYTAKTVPQPSEFLKEKVKKLRDKEVKERINGIKTKCFFKSPEAMAKDIGSLRDLVSKLARLTRIFSSRYQAAKKEKNLVDFSDMEHYSIEILLGSSSENQELTIAARELSRKYVEVMIDEYQDSNLLQEMILGAVASGGRFMVGDVKQSIYKFRRANPKLFIEKHETYCLDPDKDWPNLRVDLSKNFRSRAEVLNAANFIFCQVMDKSVGEISYDDRAALYPGAQYPEGALGMYSCEAIIVEYLKPDGTPADDSEEDELEELSKAALEAQEIGKRIMDFVNPDDPLMVAENGELRPCAFGDIVILTRSVTKLGESISQELKKVGIPAYADVQSSFFDSLEVKTALSFLKLVDNPRQDIHLVAALHSPAYGLTPDEMIDIRLQEPELSLYDCITAKLALGGCPKLEKFKKDLDSWRDEAVFVPVSDLISKVFMDTGYYAMAGAMPGGTLRQANLRTLIKKSAEFEKTDFRGLMQFLRYMERLQASGADLRSSEGTRLGAEGSGCVRIMTIHKSKGLEFPVVFVSMLGRKFNTMDEANPIILHQELGFGPVRFNTDLRTKTNTLPHFALAKKTRVENLSEELRILYVAATRAKEKLVFTGCVTKISEKREKWTSVACSDSLVLPEHYRTKCSCFLDFLAPCLARHKSGVELVSSYLGDPELPALKGHPAEFDVRIVEGIALRKAEHSFRQAAAKKLEALKGMDKDSNLSGKRELIEQALWWNYPFYSHLGIPSKVSISEMKRRYYSETTEDSEPYDKTLAIHFGLPAFLKEGREVTGIERGTAIHTVMERLDVWKHRDLKSLHELCKELIAQNILTPEER
ncbi:MAG: helicase-exonuclease AddAB subunit AddA, partial [Clostridiales bacterium]|nr:helicase-exonuclease AddAB subunit AddA [Clostridiales bacterium]